MKYHDISTGKKAPKAKALEGAKKMTVIPTGLKSSSEVRASLKPNQLKQYDRQKMERKTGTGFHNKEYGRALVKRYQDAQKHA